ncbi:hypothetical protein KUCAC02_022989, partial [Chaenocephalus aceratus]
MDQNQLNRLSAYWWQVGLVMFGSSILLAFDLSERGIHLNNPFYSVWASEIGTNISITFILVAGTSVCLYVLSLCGMVRCVFRNIGGKIQQLPAMPEARSLRYKGMIFRFNFLMLVTLACAAMTVIFFILNQVSDGPWLWGAYTLQVHSSSGGPTLCRSTVALGGLHSAGPQWLWGAYTLQVHSGSGGPTLCRSTVALGGLHSAGPQWLWGAYTLQVHSGSGGPILQVHSGSGGPTLCRSTVALGGLQSAGVYGMWNLYVFTIVFLYAPSHKHNRNISGDIQQTDLLEKPESQETQLNGGEPGPTETYRG